MADEANLIIPLQETLFVFCIFFSLLHLQIAARLQKEKKRGGGITRGEIVPVLPSQAKFLRH